MATLAPSWSIHLWTSFSCDRSSPIKRNNQPINGFISPVEIPAASSKHAKSGKSGRNEPHDAYYDTVTWKLAMGHGVNRRFGSISWLIEWSLVSFLLLCPHKSPSFACWELERTEIFLQHFSPTFFSNIFPTFLMSNSVRRLGVICLLPMDTRRFIISHSPPSFFSFVSSCIFSFNCHVIYFFFVVMIESLISSNLCFPSPSPLPHLPPLLPPPTGLFLMIHFSSPFPFIYWIVSGWFNSSRSAGWNCVVSLELMSRFQLGFGLFLASVSVVEKMAASESIICPSYCDSNGVFVPVDLSKLQIDAVDATTGIFSSNKVHVKYSLKKWREISAQFRCLKREPMRLTHWIILTRRERAFGCDWIRFNSYDLKVTLENEYS